MTPFGEEGRRLRMEGPAPGALDTVHFVDDASAGTPLPDDRVEIEVRAIGMNYRDALAAKGQVPISETGTEASGVVVSVGGGVCSLRVGDRVAALAAGAFATTARVESSRVFKIPPDMSFEDAATLPLAYCTAYYSLIDLGRLAEGESVLIHGAAGAVGQAAICLARMVGAEVLATVGSLEKKELLMREYGVPADRIFYSRSTSFGGAVRKATGDKGADVVLNSLSGEFLRESWRCLGKFGRFVDIGRRDTRVEMGHVDGNSNASFMSVDLLALAAERPRVMKRLVSDVGQLVRYGKIRPISPVTVFPISQVDAAFKTLQSTRVQGKSVVVPQKGDIVKVPPGISLTWMCSDHH